MTSIYLFCIFDLHIPEDFQYATHTFLIKMIAIKAYGLHACSNNIRAHLWRTYTFQNLRFQS